VRWYQKKHSPTHTYHGHQLSLSASSILYNHGILPVQFTYLIVFSHNLSPSFLWSTSWPGILHFILHTFLHPIIVFFLQHVPIPSQPVLLLFRDCHLILVSHPFTWNSILYLHATHPSNHSHLIFLFYGPGVTSMQHTALHTTAVQSPYY